MSARAYAIANNDIVHIAWSVDAPIAGCSGFRVIRVPSGGGHETPLKSLVAFEDRTEVSNGSGPEAMPYDPVHPLGPPALIKGFKWRDLLSPAERGITVLYKIVAMQGPEDQATPLPHVPVLHTREVTPTPHLKPLEVYFNRGILSTQSLARTLKAYGGATVAALEKALAQPHSRVREHLAAELEGAILTLLDRRAHHGGECYASLYELTDEVLISRLEAAGSHLHIVLSNNTGDAKPGQKKQYDSANHPARVRLVQSGAEVVSRYLPGSRIGHNKFMVYVDAQGTPRAVLSGSTNWTTSGLCTQNNNAIIVPSQALAARYLKYWNDLKRDTTDAGIPKKAAPVSGLQANTLRTADAQQPTTIALVGGPGEVRMWPSPNTAHLLKKPKKNGSAPATPPPTPPDMQELFTAIAAAQQAVLVLVFQPGASNNPASWTIIKQLSQLCQQKPQLFVRGAISDEAEAIEFEAARNGRMDAEMVAPAGIMRDTNKWTREVYKAGHAVVHDKIVVIDPFSSQCVVATGSHNLGYKASYDNDENLVIVRGHRPVAEAYAAHIADVIEHYRWRWYNKREAQRQAARAWVKDGSHVAQAGDKKYDANNFYQASLPQSSSWQDRYFDPTRIASLERQFWIGDGAPLPPRAQAPHPVFTSGLIPEEVAFRKALASLKKKKKK